MTNHLWQSTWFAVLVAMLVLALRKNRAQVRYSCWSLEWWDYCSRCSCCRQASPNG
jgi:hypothetical protein